MNLTVFVSAVYFALIQGSVLALISFAITLIFRTSTTTNFAQGMIATFTAYFSVWLLYKGFMVLDPDTYANNVNGLKTLYSIICLICAIGLGFLMGLFVDSVIIRNSRFPNPASKQMITLGIVLIISGFIPVIFGPTFDSMYIPRALVSVPSNVNWIIQIGSGVNDTLRVDPNHVLTIGLSTVAIIGLFLILKLSKWGLGVRSTAANEKVAGMVGVNTRSITAISWSIAAGLGALGAFLYAPFAGSFNQGLMVAMQVNGFLAGVLGGFNTFAGPVLASYIIAVTGNVFRSLNSVWGDFIMYATVLLTCLILPNGILGKKVQRKV